MASDGPPTKPPDLEPGITAAAGPATLSHAASTDAAQLLPVVCLRADDLYIDNMTEAARRELAGAALDSPAATWLRRSDPLDDTPWRAGELFRLLECKAHESSRLAWGRGVLLHYDTYTRSTAEVLVSLADDRSCFTIVFLRPCFPPAARSPEFVTANLPERSFAARVSAVSGGDSAGLSSLIQDETSRSASFSSSGHSTSASTRKSNRPAVGPERRNLPLSPEFTSMLAHATSLVTNKAGPSTTTTTDSEQHDSSVPSASHSKLPRSIEVMMGQHQSFDRGVEILSENTDRSAGRPLPFRTPSSAELQEEIRNGTPPFFAAADGAEGKSGDDAPQDSEMGNMTPPRSASGPPSPDDAPPSDARERRVLSHDQLIDLVESTPAIAFLADLNGQVVWLNRAWYDYTGADPAYNMTFEAWMSMFHPDDLQEVLPVYLGAMQSGSNFKFKYRIKRHDGVLRWHECIGAPIRNPDGGIRRWIANVCDVHEDTEARHDALLVKERIKAVLEGSNFFLLTVSPRLEVVLFEGQPPSTIALDGPETLIGGNFAELWPSPELQQAVQRVLDGEIERDYVQISEHTSDGQISHHRFRLVALRGDPAIPQIHPDANAITGVILTGADVTELVHAEEKIQESSASERAAREANRLKTQFLTTITHEIRTPIAGILGICELLLGGAEQLTDDQRNLVEQAVRSADTLLELIGAVLDLRKVEENALSLETGPFSLAEAINDARLFSVIAQKKGLAFVEDVEPYYLGTLLGDRLRLRQVLANALSNAVKFTKTGSITLACHQLAEDDKQITVCFEVCDTGIGVDSTVLPTLFEPFRQADPSTAREFGGTGLGLSISKKLVELMGGTITLESEMGVGSTVRITTSFAKAPLVDVVDTAGTQHDVPVASAREAQTAHRAQQQVEHCHRRRCVDPGDVRILLAEDNTLIRQIVTRTLKNKGFSVDAVEDGRRCIEQLQREPYHIVLMDGQMPHLDGYEATKLIRQSSDDHVRKIRIVALTASAIKGDRERCLASGMDAYLSKPVRTAELEAAIWQQVDLMDSC